MNGEEDGLDHDCELQAGESRSISKAFLSACLSSPESSHSFMDVKEVKVGKSVIIETQPSAHPPPPSLRLLNSPILFFLHSTPLHYRNVSPPQTDQQQSLVSSFVALYCDHMNE